MDIMDKTLKIRAYSDAAKSEVPQGNLADKNTSPEFTKVAAQLEEEKSKTLELLKTIVQLRESLKQEQEKSAEMARKAAEMEGKANELALRDANQLAKKDALLDEEKKKSIEQLRTIEQLKESIRQDQAKMADTHNMSARLEAKTKEVAMLETQIKELSAVLNKIVSIAAARKLDSGPEPRGHAEPKPEPKLI